METRAAWETEANDREESSTELKVGRRLDSRLRVYFPAKLTSVFGVQQVHLQNLSRGGFKLRWSQPIKAGSDVVIAWSHYELFGTVAWSQLHYGRVALETRLPHGLILAMREQESPRQPHVRREATEWYLDNLRYHKGYLRRA